MSRVYRVESLTLRNMGVFKHMRFNFPAPNRTRSAAEKAEIHLFTGLNGCGKSTVLAALAAIFLPDEPHGRAPSPRHYPDAHLEYQFAGKADACFVGHQCAFSKQMAAGHFAAFYCSGNDVFRPPRQPLTPGLQRRIADFICNISGIDLLLPTGNQQSIDLALLPDGIKSLAGWITDLAARLEQIPWQQARDSFSQPLLLFLDDVDIHLHPRLQRRILPALQTLLPQAQIFVSTYSPFVVGSVNDAWVWRLPDPARTLSGAASEATEIVPVPSGAGKSYQLILEEVFNIDEQFDLETEMLLERFYQLRDSYLKKRHNKDKLMEIADKIRERGEELEAIVGLELRQIARRNEKG